MIQGFQKYLIDNGFKRFETVVERGKVITRENNTSYSVSSYGPTAYSLEKENIKLYWGLGVANKSPYYYFPSNEHYEIILSRDMEKDLKGIITRTIEQRLIE